MVGTQVESMQTRASLRWRVRPIGDELGEQAPWESLAREHALTPFAEPYWLRCWWRNFRENGTSLTLLEGHAADRLAAVIPAVRSAGFVRRLRLPYNPHVPITDICWNGAGRSAIVDALGECARNADVFELGALPTESVLLSSLRSAAAGHGVTLHELPRHGNVFLQWDSNWAGLRSRLSKKLMSDTERRERNLGKLGRLEFSVLSEPADATALLDECIAIEEASWKGAKGSAIACNPATTGFYRDLASEAGAVGQWRLYTLRLDGRVIAFQYCLLHRNTLYVLKESYDESLNKHAPGNVLRVQMLRSEADSDGAKCLDLGINAPWKASWTDGVTPLSRVELYFGARGRLAYWTGPGIRRVLKSNRLVANWIQHRNRQRNEARQAERQALRESSNDGDVGRTPEQ